MKMKRVIGLSIIVTAAISVTVLTLRVSERNAMSSPQEMCEKMDMIDKMEMMDKMEVADLRDKMDMMEKMEMADKMEVADLLDAARSSASGNNFSGANEKVANARGLAVDNTDRSKIASTEVYIEGNAAATMKRYASLLKRRRKKRYASPLKRRRKKTPSLRQQSRRKCSAVRRRQAVDIKTKAVGMAAVVTPAVTTLPAHQAHQARIILLPRDNYSSPPARYNPAADNARINNAFNSAIKFYERQGRH